MKKFTILLTAVFIIAFVAGVAFASLSSVQKIFNDVWSDSNNTLKIVFVP